MQPKLKAFFQQHLIKFGVWGSQGGKCSKLNMRIKMPGPKVE